MTLALVPGYLFEPNPIGLMKTWLIFVPVLVSVFFLTGWLPKQIRGAE